jgi:ATP-dependent protease ClpP protease subunit
VKRSPGAERARKIVNARPEAEADRSWYRIVLDAARPSDAEVWLYDEIGYWGITAAQFAAELAALDVSTINLRVNSPGGEVFDGIAIYNALKNHKAAVNVSVDGLAASIASVISMAGDTITMQRGAQMMIHDASGLCYGNAADMATMGALLDKLSDTIAGFYADKAGGSLTSWRDVMRAETWYSPDEAVAAGLATTAAKDPAPEDSAVPRHTWDLRDVLGYRYANRSEAPAPALVDRTEPAELPTEPVDLGALSGAILAGFSERMLPAIDLSSLHAAIQLGTTTVPAPEPTPAPVPLTDDTDSPTGLDIRALTQSVREGRL